MATEHIEAVAAKVTIWGSIVALGMDVLDFLSKNQAAISVLILIGGFALQAWASRRNRAKVDADEKRAQEEHEVKMAVLRGELPGAQAVVEKIEAVE